HVRPGAGPRLLFGDGARPEMVSRKGLPHCVCGRDRKDLPGRFPVKSDFAPGRRFSERLPFLLPAKLYILFIVLSLFFNTAIIPFIVHCILYSKDKGRTKVLRRQKSTAERRE